MRLYRIPYQGTLATASGDLELLEVLPADDKPVRLVGWIMGQTSEVGDTAEESVRITVRHMAATVTSSNGTSVTPVKTDQTDAAAGFTAECNGATVATTSGTSTILEELGWNIRNTPWERWIPEEMRPVARQGEGLFVRLETTLADDISAQLTFFVEEM